MGVQFSGVRAALYLVLGGTALSLVGCKSTVEEASRCVDYYGGPTRITVRSVDKLDLLLVIDNSRSMADKQQILGLAVADLINELVNPRCLASDGTPTPSQPTDPGESCPASTRRAFAPFVDVHIGVVSSSIGGHGADCCDASSVPSENDRAHLITRTSTDGASPDVEGWDGKKFLVWDPSTDSPTHAPQGETDRQALIGKLTSMVTGVDEAGCGFEAPLEAWYRFLVDPDPHQEIEIVDSKATLVGTDQTLLTQRAEFLRPNSLLAIIMLSDENDCSIRDGGHFYFAAQAYEPGTSNPYHLPKPRAACATDPTSHCCRSCAQTPGDGCSTDQDDCDGAVSALEDHINLRCFDQKRRFGIDFLWPIDRYVTGLTACQVADRHGNVVQNPLFTDLNPHDSISTVRNAGLVLLLGIVGVPWQDIARKNAQGQPDLLDGLDHFGRPFGGLQSGAEFAMNDVWDIILGDPASYIDPTDPLMIESIAPRSGTNPVTGDPLQPPGSSSVHPINGSEYTIAGNDDLQYACIFSLPQPRDCTDPNQIACDCADPNNDNPLCSSATPTLQERAKASPSIRQLSVLEGLGSRGTVASICPAQLTEPSLPSFGYRPAVTALLTPLTAALGEGCFPHSLTVNADGQVECSIVEARKTDVCACNPEGRRTMHPGDPAIAVIKKDPLHQTAGWNCFCEIEQTLGSDTDQDGVGDDLEACQYDPSHTPVNVSGQPVHGWCYLDATTVPPTGSPDLLASCPALYERTIRFVGDGVAASGATLYIFCDTNWGSCD